MNSKMSFIDVYRREIVELIRKKRVSPGSTATIPISAVNQ